MIRKLVLEKTAVATVLVFGANLFLAPLALAGELATQAQVMETFMQKSGAFPRDWNDTRKSMLTLRQRVKDSRLDLDSNGIEHYRGKAKVMLDLERQRMRRAADYLLRNQHGTRLREELRKTREQELIQLANNMEISTMSGQNDSQAVLDNYLGFRVKGYEEVVTRLEQDKVRSVMVDTEAAVDAYVASGGDVSKLDRGLFAKDDAAPESNKLLRWVIAAIAGVGLVIAVFFSITTMTMTPFLTFMATVVGLLALLGRVGAFQSVFYGSPYGPTPGPYSPYQPWNPYWPPQQQPYQPPAG